MTRDPTRGLPRDLLPRRLEAVSCLPVVWVSEAARMKEVASLSRMVSGSRHPMQVCPYGARGSTVESTLQYLEAVQRSASPIQHL